MWLCFRDSQSNFLSSKSFSGNSYGHGSCFISGADDGQRLSVEGFESIVAEASLDIRPCGAVAL